VTARKTRKFGRKDRDKSAEVPEKAGQADEQYLRDIGYQPNVNQLRHEPMPASTHEDRDQEALRRNNEAASASARAQPLRGSRPRPLDQSGVEQRPGTDTEGLAERWRASHEEWRQRMRSQNG
jgi:hypothetical protein